MPIPVQCAHCQSAFQVADKFGGRKIRCPKCQTGVVEVPAPAAPVVTDDPLGGLDDVFSSAAAMSAAPPPKRRRSAQQQASLRQWLTIVAVLFGVLIAGGVLVGAGVYAWQISGDMKMPDLGMPDLSLPSVGGQAKGPPSSLKNWQLYQCQQPPFEIYFPSNEVNKLSIGNATYYLWTSTPIKPGNVENLAVLGVSYFPRQPGESDLDALYRVERETKAGADGTVRNGVQVSTRETKFQGMTALERTLSGDLHSLNSVSTIAAHPSGVFAISGICHSRRFSMSQLRAMRDSFRIVDPAAAAASESGSQTAAAILGKGKLFQCAQHPFEMMLPSETVIETHKDGTTLYTWISNENSFRRGENMPDYALICVQHFPRNAHETDEQAIRRVEREAGIAPDGATRKGAKMVYQPTRHSGYYAVDRQTEGATPPVNMMGITIAHPSGVYHLFGVANKAYMSKDELESLKRSFRFTQ